MGFFSVILLIGFWVVVFQCNFVCWVCFGESFFCDLRTDFGSVEWGKVFLGGICLIGFAIEWWNGFFQCLLVSSIGSADLVSEELYEKPQVLSGETWRFVNRTRRFYATLYKSLLITMFIFTKLLVSLS